MTVNAGTYCFWTHVSLIKQQKHIWLLRCRCLSMFLWTAATKAGLADTFHCARQQPIMVMTVQLLCYLLVRWAVCIADWYWVGWGWWASPEAEPSALQSTVQWVQWLARGSFKNKFGGPVYVVNWSIFVWIGYLLHLFLCLSVSLSLYTLKREEGGGVFISSDQLIW